MSFLIDNKLNVNFSVVDGKHLHVKLTSCLNHRHNNNKKTVIKSLNNLFTGVVPANGSTTIHIQYQPINYCTSTMRLQLDVSQFNFKPLVCTITGYCAPGVNAV